MAVQFALHKLAKGSVSHMDRGVEPESNLGVNSVSLYMQIAEVDSGDQFDIEWTRAANSPK